ncbi:nitroreductase family protein [Nocardioides zeae]|uniref:Nitroreductase n=1 Tax=Nocardioides zeae TaxID=1457234 RepID=A0AAJ1U5H7_9ACTN|nr:nitroreductase family protein [Nocardioides zeae]MDQ1106350.1 nitroreductase [Nocardioides zeae]
MHPDVPRLRELHHELNRTATGGVDDPRGAREVLPPLVGSGSSPVPLPDTALPAAHLGEVLAARRSSYRYGAAPVALDDLAALLRAALGVQRTVRLPDGQARALSVAPSAGGLPSLAAYVVVRGPGVAGSSPGVVRGPGVAGSSPGPEPGLVPDGVYRAELRTEAPSLVPVRVGDATPFLARALDQPELAERAGVVVALVARLDTTLGRYPARHYRTLHLDAGVALGHLYLATTALGLPGVAVMGYDDTAFDALLDLPEDQLTAVLFAVGSPVEG